MDAELKKTWVAALRSGKYLQTRRQLRSPNGGYCCLGVLCRVAKIAIAKNGQACSRNRDYQPIYDLIGGAEARTLMALNDRAMSTFSQIADAIETSM